MSLTWHWVSTQRAPSRSTARSLSRAGPTAYSLGFDIFEAEEGFPFAEKTCSCSLEAVCVSSLASWKRNVGTASHLIAFT